MAAARAAEDILRGSQAEVAVAQPVMKTAITIHRAAEAEAAEGKYCHKTDKTSKTLFLCWEGNGSQPLAVAYPD